MRQPQAGSRDSFHQRVARNVLHHDDIGAFAGQNIMNDDDVRMVQGGRSLRFPQKPAALIGIARLQEHFERDRAI